MLGRPATGCQPPIAPLWTASESVTCQAASEFVTLDRMETRATITSDRSGPAGRRLAYAGLVVPPATQGPCCPQQSFRGRRRHSGWAQTAMAGLRAGPTLDRAMTARDRWAAAALVAALLLDLLLPALFAAGTTIRHAPGRPPRRGSLVWPIRGPPDPRWVSPGDRPCVADLPLPSTAVVARDGEAMSGHTSPAAHGLPNAPAAARRFRGRSWAGSGP